MRVWNLYERVKGRTQKAGEMKPQKAETDTESKWYVSKIILVYFIICLFMAVATGFVWGLLIGAGK